LLLTDAMMVYMMFMIRALQLVMHLPMLQVVIPSNVSMLTEMLSPVVMFDVLENEWGYDITWILEFDTVNQTGEDITD
jgi:hypothetical protein